MHLSLVDFLVRMRESKCTISTDAGILTCADGTTLDINQAIEDLDQLAKDQQADVPASTKLQTALTATQTALSQAMQHAEKAHAFVESTASLRLWGYDHADGSRCEECEEPSDGYLDSHNCLMDIIQEARALLNVSNEKGESAQ